MKDIDDVFSNDDSDGLSSSDEMKVAVGSTVVVLENKDWELDSVLLGNSECVRTDDDISLLDKAVDCSWDVNCMLDEKTIESLEKDKELSGPETDGYKTLEAVETGSWGRLEAYEAIESELNVDVK